MICESRFVPVQCSYSAWELVLRLQLRLRFVKVCCTADGWVWSPDFSVPSLPFFLKICVRMCDRPLSGPFWIFE